MFNWIKVFLLPRSVSLLLFEFSFFFRSSLLGCCRGEGKFFGVEWESKKNIINARHATSWLIRATEDIRARVFSLSLQSASLFYLQPRRGPPSGVSCIPPRAERILKCLHFCLVVRWVVGNNTGNIVSFIRRLSSW